MKLTSYCHTRPRGKTYPIPEGFRGWAEEWLYNHSTSQPADHPSKILDYLSNI